MALRLALAGLLIAQGLPASAQSDTDPAARPVLRQLARSSSGADGDQGMLRNAQFMPGMPQMQMPPMLAPRTGGSQGSMGSGMTMVMTGDTILEMMAGACTAGLFIGGVAAAVATAPAAPITVGVIASSAGIGCGWGRHGRDDRLASGLRALQAVAQRRTDLTGPGCCDRKVSDLGWMYTLFFVFLSGAALPDTWFPLRSLP